MDAATFLKRKSGPLAAEGERRDGLACHPEDYGSSSRLTIGAKPSAASGPDSSSETSESSPLWIPETTPNGTLVEYCPKPRGYRVNGVKAPSVTTVLKVLAKELSWWGMTTGVSGVLELFEREKLTTALDWLADRQRVVVDAEHVIPATTDAVVAMLTAEKLTVNHTKDKAADRGTSVHSGLQAWADSGGEFFPTPQSYPEEQREHINGVLAWLDAMGGAGKPVLSEVMVGSVEHGFAGRCDLVLELSEEREFVVRALKKPKTIVVQPGRYMVDMKTKNKRPRDPYTTDMKQLAAYELAAVEGGYPPTDGQFVLYVMANGTYEFVPSRASAEDFLAVLKVYQLDEKL